MLIETSTTMSAEEMQAGMEARGMEAEFHDVAGNIIQPTPAAAAPVTPPAPPADPEAPPPAAVEDADAAHDPEATAADPQRRQQPPRHGTYRDRKFDARARVQQAVQRQREAERALQAQAEQNEALNRRLADIEARLTASRPAAETAPAAAAPAATPQPAAPAIAAEPEPPELPDLELLDNDWDKYRAAMRTYHQGMVKYNKELAQWIADQRVSTLRQEQSQQAVEQALGAKNNEGREIYGADEWNRAMQSAAPVTFAPEFVNRAFQSDLYPHVMFHLANQPDDATYIASLSPADQVYELAQLERVLETDLAQRSPARPALPAPRQAPPVAAVPAAPLPAPQLGAPSSRVAPTRTVAPIVPVNAGTASAAPGGDLEQLAQSNSRSYRELRRHQIAARRGF